MDGKQQCSDLPKRREDNILITGGDGFLGKLLERCLTIRGYACQSYDITSGQDILNYDQFHESLEKSKSSTVIHLAAVSDLNIMRQHPEKSNAINIDGTRNVLNACNKLGVRLLFASTCCIYGNNDEHPSSETSKTCPTEIYAISKKKCEKMIGASKENRHVNLRLATFYGGTMRSALVLAVFMRLVMEGKPLTIHGDGLQTRTYTHADDIVSGIIAILEAPEDKYFPVVNISVSESTNVLEVAECVMEVLGKKVPVTHGEDRPGQIYKESIDNSRLLSLGWKPKFTFKEGVLDCYRHIKETSDI